MIWGACRGCGTMRRGAGRLSPAPDPNGGRDVGGVEVTGRAIEACGAETAGAGASACGVGAGTAGEAAATATAGDTVGAAPGVETGGRCAAVELLPLDAGAADTMPAVAGGWDAGGGAAAMTGLGAGALGKRGGAAAAACRSWIARSTSPGLETLDKSILGRSSPSRPPLRRTGELPRLPPRVRETRTRSASSASRELECVFFSVTPTAVRTSRMALLFTSSSRARSLIRTLLIRPFIVRPNRLHAHCYLGGRRIVASTIIARNNRFCFEIFSGTEIAG